MTDESKRAELRAAAELADAMAISLYEYTPEHIAKMQEFKPSWRPHQVAGDQLLHLAGAVLDAGWGNLDAAEARYRRLRDAVEALGLSWKRLGTTDVAFHWDQLGDGLLSLLDADGGEG